MPLVVKDRVRETSTTAGTGTFTLAGAVLGYQSFSAIGNGNTTYYTIYLQGGNEWEVGIGTYTASGTTLSRDTILASSNGGSAVNFSAGVKDVFVTYPAGRSVYYDTATNVTLNALTVTGALAANGGTTIGDASGDAFTINSNSVSVPNGLNFDSNTFVIDAANNRAGVGTATPITKLQAAGGNILSTTTYNSATQLIGTYIGESTDGNLYAEVDMRRWTGAGTDHGTGRISVDASSNIIFFNNAQSSNTYATTEHMRLDSFGTLILRQSSNSANTSVSLNTTIQNALTLEADGDLLVGTTTNTNSSKLVASGTISETVSSTQYLVASQYDIGTAANEIPLNQYLGNLAYQDSGSIAGQVGLSAGTAALPSLVSATDTDTGMWFPAANTLAWSTGGTERARITSGGDFLVGTTSVVSGVAGIQAGAGKQVILEVGSGSNANFISNVDAPLIYGSGSGGTIGFNGHLVLQPRGSAAGAILFATGNGAAAMTERARITSGGDFGIGTTSPAAKLDVQGLQNGISNPVNGTINVVDTAAAALGVGGQIVFRGSYTGTTSTMYAAITAYKESATVDGSQYGAALIFNTRTQGGNNTEKMRIDSSGNVGLGVTPSAWGSGRTAIQVYGSSTAAYFAGGTFNTYFSTNYYYNSGDKFIGATNYASYYTQSYLGQHQWWTSSAASSGADSTATMSQLMTLDSLGRLGVGATNPDSMVEINSATAAYARFKINYNSSALAYFGSYSGIVGSGNATDTMLSSQAVLAFGAGGTTERARITSDGNFLVGTTDNTTGNKIVTSTNIGFVAGATIPQINYYSSASTIEYVNRDSGGSKTFSWYYQASAAGSPATLSTSGVWTNASDARGKENISDIHYGLDTVLALQPRQYDVKSDGSHAIGFVAQEVLPVVPELVHVTRRTESDEFYGLDYGSMTAVLVKAIQEQQTMINELKAEVAALKGA